MATLKSNQRTASSGATADPLTSSEAYGKVRVSYWDFLTDASSGPQVGDTIELVDLPAGARVLHIFQQNEAMSTAGGTAGVSLGDADDADRFIATMDLEAAHNDWIVIRHSTADGEASVGCGYKYDEAAVLTATVTGEAWATSKSYRGFVLYAVE